VLKLLLIKFRAAVLASVTAQCEHRCEAISGASDIVLAELNFQLKTQSVIGVQCVFHRLEMIREVTVVCEMGWVSRVESLRVLQSLRLALEILSWRDDWHKLYLWCLEKILNLGIALNV